MSVSGLPFRVAGSEVQGVWCGEVGIVSEGLGMGCVRSLWVGLMGQEKVAVLFVGSLRFDCSCSAPALHSAWSDLSVTLSCCKFCTSLFVFSSCTVTFSGFLAALADLVLEGLSDRGGGVVGEDLLFWFHQLHLLQG